MMSGTNNNGTILEDDQQLYDWGIENRLDQYYQVTQYLARLSKYFYQKGIRL